MLDSLVMKNGLRVTLVTGSLGSGGTERIVLWLAGALAQAGHKPTVMTLHDATADFYDIPPEVPRIKASQTIGSSYRWFDLAGQFRSIKALRHTLSESAPDVVISFIDSVNVQVLQALIGTGIPVIVSEQTDWRYHPVSLRWRLMRQLLYPYAHSVVVLSSALEKEVTHRQTLWRGVRIPNPVPRIMCKDIVKPEQFGQFTVMAMGRLAPEKGFDLLLHAFRQVADDFPDWTLVIIGEGPELASLFKLIEHLALADRVFMAGVVSPPFDWLHAGDLFVFSSLYEGFGLALAEAMACGLPVISFDCPSGPRDIIRHGIDGLLVPPNDVNALAGAMKSLMEDALKRVQLAQRAPEVCDRFAPDLVFDQWHRLIISAVSGTV